MSDYRIVILDYNHLVHQYLNSKAPRLFYNIQVAGRDVNVETTIPAYTIKAMHRFSRYGRDVFGVCFDSAGTFRKEYFSKKPTGEKTDIVYKGGRKGLPSNAYQGIDLTVDCLSKTDMSIYKAEGYEADDLVYSLVMKCKELYPDVPIDVICNDADLIPLVDEQVSVFIKNRRLTWAESKDLEKNGYWQVTPYNYSEVVEGMSKYKKFNLPYNTLLLHKLLRGDDSDGIPGLIVPDTGKLDFPPKMYNELVSILDSEMHDLEKIFRYPVFQPKIQKENGNGRKLSELYEECKQESLDLLVEVLSNYVDDYTIEHIKFIYGGMAPKFVGLKEPKCYTYGSLQKEAVKLGIHITDK